MHDNEEKPRHSAERYQGKRLLYLVLAICLPAALLYLRIVCGIAATDSRIAISQTVWLARLSMAALLLFFIAQLASARYVQRLLQPRQTPVGNALQYLAVFGFCMLFSLTGAIILEAFGFNVFLRAAAIH
jgi:hypothetical protein